jgi:signal transduction histidine kinase
MKLRTRLFISYLVVVLVSIGLLGALTTFVAPSALLAISRVEIVQRGGRPFFQLREVTSPVVFVEDVRLATSQALLIAGVVAVLFTIVVSWYMSRRIVRRLREVAAASQDIASGHYERRLHISSDDELGELAANFNRMAQALAETENARRQLMADVSHELKTPLASIKGYMEGLEDGVIPPTPETFHLVYREADRLQRLVHDLQAISQVEAGAPHVSLAPCAPAALAEAAISRLQPQFAEKGVTLTQVMSPALPQVCADPDRTVQVLLNLIGNALQYTPPGGGVTVRLTRDASQVRFSIEDTGIGLEADDQERVFQRFYRVDKSRARASGGSGIGLTIAKYLVEAQGGRIWAESDGVGRGSAFHFTLPTA